MIQLNDEKEEKAISLYRYVKELGLLKYESELRRQDSLIQQSSYMQTAFAFMTAALFMALPVLISNRGSLSFKFIFIATSSIVLFLLFSLLFATFTQHRFKQKALMDIDEIEDFVSQNWATTYSESQQLKQWVDLMSNVQKSITKNNNIRITFIIISMISFIISIALIIFWFVTAMFKLL